MNKFDVIVLNSHGVGQYADACRLPVWGETLRVTNWRIAEDGGKGTNVAVALGRLGIQTAYVGKVGDDPWGYIGEKWMNDAGVNTKYMYKSKEVATGTGLILIGPDGQNTIIDGDSSSVALTAEEVETAIKNMQDSRMLITGFEIPEQRALEGARLAHSLGIATVLNPSPLPEYPIEDLSYIDYLFINEVEGRFLLGQTESEEIIPEQMTRLVREQYGCKTIILTLGAKGAAGLDGEGFWEIPAVTVPPEKIINTAGAGDGFLAATAAKLMQGSDIRSATRWASAYSALSITIDGTIPSYRYAQEVEKFISTLAT